MKLPLTLAQKLIDLLEGNELAESTLRHSIIEELLAENILTKSGRIKQRIQLVNAAGLQQYLHNHFGIADIAAYVNTFLQESTTKADWVVAASDSKIKVVRSFKGFLVNCLQPLSTTLNHQSFTIQPQEGCFTFVYDTEAFVPHPSITIVGMENPENFRHLKQQAYLFENITPLFVSRYPQNQSKDLLKWLMAIPNSYLHFGDIDLAGINIYANEYKKHLGGKANFLIPNHLQLLLEIHGNKARYDEQKSAFDSALLQDEPQLLALLQQIHQMKKGLDQEIFIRG